MSAIFDHCVAKIQQEYVSLGHTLGWRFLYSPVSTLSPDAKIMFVGLNPGGNRYVGPMPSVEKGNAYHIERWEGNAGHNVLQKQVIGLYQKLAIKIGCNTYSQLMDQSLTLNFCPFRSSSWKTLPRQFESEQFSRQLWHDIFNTVIPPIIICLSDKPYKELRNILIGIGYSVQYSNKDYVGWGNVTYSEEKLILNTRSVYLLRIPHLSRFQIVGKASCDPVVEAFTKTIALELSSSTQ